MISRIRARRTRLRKALRCRLCGRCYRHVHGSAILPSLLKQDPRYFYKGTGSMRSRVLYALASPMICKGDNELAAKLLRYPRKFRRGRYLKSLLSSE